MNKLDQLKKYAPYAAAIACLWYEAFNLAGSGSFINGVMYVAILVAGICCIVEKPKVDLIGFVSLAVATTFAIFGFFGDVIEIFGHIVDGYSVSYIIHQILWLLPAIVILHAIAAMAVLAFFYFKKQTGIVTKFWYVPAALVLLYALMHITFSVLFFFIFHDDMFGFNPDFVSVSRYFTHSIGVFINYIFLTIGFAGIGLHNCSKLEQ